ncbi:hypothetical protein AAF712_016310 [Marasmius tenuissimus]|uniref:Uncharacterized protein n=1 Tax=Marasmius tenuissimus TaxID=585030 RepID=A0ABR2Z733_9AGAR
MIPSPSFGSTRNLYRREDGFFGADDPVLTPQPFHHRHVYPAWIPCSPTTDNHPYADDYCMWARVRVMDLDLSRQGVARKEGVPRSGLADDLKQAVTRLRERLQGQGRVESLGSVNIVELLRKFNDTLTVCLNRVTTIAMPLRDVQQGVAELQRAWLYSVALSDWAEASAQSESNRVWTDPHCRMGAYIWNDREALFLFCHQLPVYYVCPHAAFDRQIILSVKEFVTPIICNTLALPPYPILISNDQAGSDTKFSAIRAAATTCFSVSSPFANMHLPGAYVSLFGSTSAGGIISSADSQPSCSAGGVTRSVSATSSRYSPLSGAQP